MKPLVIVWRVTGRCNLSCAFCAYDRTQNISRRHTDESLVRQFAELAASLSRPVLLSWLGGEPLLWPALTQLTRDLRQRHGFAISTTTNGTTLHREDVRQHLIEHYAELTISLDGPAPLHDALRGQSGLFKQIQHAVKQIAGRGPRLRINTVLMRHTIAHFPALCREVARWGIDEITCNQLGGIERPEFYPANRLLPEQVSTLSTQWPALHPRPAASPRPTTASTSAPSPPPRRSPTCRTSLPNAVSQPAPPLARTATAPKCAQSSSRSEKALP